MQILNSCKYGDQKSHKREVYFVTDTAVDWVDIIKEEWEMKDKEWLFQSEIKIYSWESGKGINCKPGWRLQNSSAIDWAGKIGLLEVTIVWQRDRLTDYKS